MNRSITAVLLSLTLFMPCVKACAEKFEKFDLDAGLASCSLCTRFDYSTKRFQGTSSEFRDLASLSRAISDIDNRLNEQIRISQTAVSKMLVGKTHQDETGFWRDLGAVSSLTGDLRRQKSVLEAELAMGERTSDDSILPSINQISKDLESRIPNSSGTIIINRLPRLPPCSLPSWEISPFHIFLWQPEPRLLETYLDQALSIGSLFPGISEPILFSNRSKKGVSP